MRNAILRNHLKVKNLRLLILLLEINRIFDIFKPKINGMWDALTLNMLTPTPFHPFQLKAFVKRKLRAVMEITSVVFSRIVKSKRRHSNL